VHDMAVERSAALIEPAMRRTERGTNKALKQFRKHIEQFARQQPGTGLEPPQWIQRLEEEANRVRSQQDATIERIKERFQVPRITVNWHELVRLAEESELDADEPPVI